MNACAMPGVQLARMTPFRSYVAVIGAAVATIFARQLQLNNGMRTYISVRYQVQCLVVCYAMLCSVWPYKAVQPG